MFCGVFVHVHCIVCMCLCVCASVFVCACIVRCVCACVFVCVHAYVHVHVCACMWCVCVYVLVQACMCICVIATCVSGNHDVACSQLREKKGRPSEGLQPAGWRMKTQTPQQTWARSPGDGHPALGGVTAVLELGLWAQGSEQGKGALGSGAISEAKAGLHPA